MSSYSQSRSLESQSVSTSNSNNSRDSNSLSQSLSQSVGSERFSHNTKRNRCDGNRLNLNLLFIGVVFLFLFMSIKGEIIPKKLFSKENLLNSISKIIPDAKKN